MRRGKAARGLATRGRLWEAALRTVTAKNANPREWGTVGQVPIPALCPRRLWEAALREFSIRVHSCYSWIASVQTCDAPPRCVAGGLRLFSIRVYSCYSWMAVCNRESRQSTRMGNSRGRFSYLPHVSHKGTETQRDKDSEKTLCAFVSLCEPPAVTANHANPREWGTVGAGFRTCPMFHTKAQRHKGIKTRRKPSVPSCLCVSLCNRESRQSTRMGNSRGRFSYLPHVSHKGTETQSDKDSEKTLCAFVSLCEPPAAMESRPT